MKYRHNLLRLMIIFIVIGAGFYIHKMIIALINLNR